MGLRTALSVRYAQVVRLHSITVFQGPIGFSMKFFLVLSRLYKTGLSSQKMNLIIWCFKKFSLLHLLKAYGKQMRIWVLILGFKGSSAKREQALISPHNHNSSLRSKHFCAVSEQRTRNKSQSHSLVFFCSKTKQIKINACYAGYHNAYSREKQGIRINEMITKGSCLDLFNYSLNLNHIFIKKENDCGHWGIQVVFVPEITGRVSQIMWCGRRHLSS